MQQKKVLTPEDLVIGGKYVPHQKTIGCSLNESPVWNRCQIDSQLYIYYIGKNEYGTHLFSELRNGNPRINGDFFNPEDVTPYIEHKQESFEDAKERMAYQAADWQDYENKTGSYLEHKEEVSKDSKTLEQAATEHANQVFENKDAANAKLDFIAGANWQKKQDLKTHEHQKTNEIISKLKATNEHIAKGSEEQTKALQESHDKLLEALDVAFKSLCTYGSHPIIEKQVEAAIDNAKRYTTSKS